MSSPYENTVSAQILRGEDQCIRLPAPHRGELQRLVIQQHGEEKLGFTANLYSSKTVCEDAEDDLSVSAVGTKDPSIYKVIPTQTAAPGATIVEIFNGEYGYQIKEATHNVPDTELFLVINCTGVGQHVEFDIGYVIQPVFY